MGTSWKRRLTAGLGALVLVTAAPMALPAEDAASQRSTQAAPAAEPDTQQAPTCGGAAGACCASCQKQAAKAASGSPALGCPCQRARKARQKL